MAGLFCAATAIPGLDAQTSPAAPGKTRTYYVAADEVNWDYAPSGHDEAMGMDFDAVARGYTEPGPHQIGPRLACPYASMDMASEINPQA